MLTTVWEVEPNNDFQQAVTLTPLPATAGGELLGRLGRGSIDSSTYADFWRLEAQAGDRVRVAAEGGRWDNSLVLDILNEQGQWVASARDPMNGRPEVHLPAVAAPGTYYIRTDTYAPSASPVDYALRIDVARGPALETEPNDRQAFGNVLPWQPRAGQRARGQAAGSSASPLDTDWYDLGRLNAGDHVDVRLALPTESSVEPRVRLVRGQDAVTVSSFEGAGPKAFVVPEDGAYHIEVAAAVAASAGIEATYLLQVDLIDVSAPLVVAATLPPATGTVDQPLSRFSVQFSEELLAGLAANPQHYRLREAGPDGGWGGSDDVVWTLTPSYRGVGSSVDFTIGNGPLTPGSYRFEILDGLTDRAGRALPAYTQEFAIPTPPYADLVVGSVTPSPVGFSGRPLQIEWEVQNQGTAPTAVFEWLDTVALTRNADGSDVVAQLSGRHFGVVATGVAYARRAELTLPHGLNGTFYAAVTTGSAVSPSDAPADAAPHNTNNVRISGPIEVQLTPPPDLVVTALQTPAEIEAGQQIEVTWTVHNQGEGLAAGSWSDQLALVSMDNTQVIPLDSFDYQQPLEPGKSYTRTELIWVPEDLEGIYRFRLTTNASNALYEHTWTGNNRLDSDQPLTFTRPPRPDLQVQSITAPAEAPAGGTLSLEFTIINQGTAAPPAGYYSSATWYDRVYLSQDDKIDGSDRSLGQLQNVSTLEPGQSYINQVTRVEIPRNASGTWFLIVQTDSNGYIYEGAQENNNQFALPILINPIPRADLVVTSVVAPTQGIGGNQIEVGYTVANRGPGVTDRSSWTDEIWLTTGQLRPDRNFPGNDRRLGTVTRQGELASDEQYEVVTTVTAPTGVISGEYFITVWTDASDAVLEDTYDVNLNPGDPHELDNNNYRSRPITVLTTPPAVPDLAVTALSVSADKVPAGQPVTIRWTVENVGKTPTDQDYWYDYLVLSESPVLYAYGTEYWDLGSVYHSGDLAEGQGYSVERTINLSPDVSGLYLFVFTPTLSNEPNTADNVRMVPLELTRRPADLQVTSLVVPSQAFSGEPVEVQWTVTNVGHDVWSGTVSWPDAIYLSADPYLNPGPFLQHEYDSKQILRGNQDIRLGNFTRRNTPVLRSGESYTAVGTVTLPRGIEGTYYLLIDVDSDGEIPENDYWHGNSNDSHRSFFTQHAYEGLGPSAENNVAFAALPVDYREPDLRVHDLALSSGLAVAGQAITVTWNVTNIGSRDTRESEYCQWYGYDCGWYDRVYLSRDASLDRDDKYLGQFHRSQVLGQGASYQGSLDVTLPDTLEGEYYVLVFTDSHVSTGNPLSVEYPYYYYPIPKVQARVEEFPDEGNNIAVLPLTVTPTPKPDLQVTAVTVPEHVQPGQWFTISYEVTNTGTVPTPQTYVYDSVYLSRDKHLDPNRDLYLSYTYRYGSLQAGESYERELSLWAPEDLTGPYYVFVMTDQYAYYSGNGNVFEGPGEGNNSRASDTPVLFDPSLPTDLQALSISLPAAAVSGEEFTIEWTVSNCGDVPADYYWQDAAYLSADAVWDVEDRLLGHFDYWYGLEPGDIYTAELSTTLPPVKPGRYYVIVRPDILDQVPEGSGEANNRMSSAGTVAVSVPELQLGVPLETTLSTNQERLFRVSVDADQTLLVSLTTASQNASNEVFLRHEDVPTAVKYDAAYEGPLQANQYAREGGTDAGTYYVLIRGHYEPQANTPVTLLADTLPLTITSVEPDIGGDGRYVTLVLRGAQFDEQAIVKLVRPGLAEYEPVRHQVLDSTHIIAIFDLRGAPHALYDVKVINPDGEAAVVPYRYLVERALEPDVTVGLGGPRVLSPGSVGEYSFSLRSLTNLDTPYVYFQFGVPELGINPIVFNLAYVRSENNFRGDPGVPDVPWASLDSEVNTAGYNLAPGYAYDFAARSNLSLNFTAHVYPGFQEIMNQDFEKLKTKIEQLYPEYRGYLDKGPEGLNDIYPGLKDIYDRVVIGPLDYEDPCDIAFNFHLIAAATPLTRQEFIARMRQEAAALRDRVLADATATAALKSLAADAATWEDAYLAALEQANLLRPEDEAPPVREREHVISLMATLATGLVVGPAGQSIRTSGDLVEFFTQVRRWYGHEDGRVLPPGGHPLGLPLPDPATFDLGVSHATHQEAFQVYVPFSNRMGSCGNPPTNGNVTPPDLEQFFADAGQTGGLARLEGPQAYGSEQFVPVGQRLPYTIRFDSPASPVSTHEIRIVSQLDADLDARSFRLGDLRIGDLQVHLPADRGSFQGDFDFRHSRRYILRVSATIEMGSRTAIWLLQAINPESGEILRDPNRGLLPPGAAIGSGGFVSFSVVTGEGLTTGTILEAQARVLYDNVPPQDTAVLRQTIDARAPQTTISAAQTAPGSSNYQVQWSAQDDAGGSGVKHVTVYVSKDGGDYTIWLSRTLESVAIYQGEAGHTYEFLALATDHAGNRERVSLNRLVPDDGSRPDVGNTPDVGTSTPPDPPPPPPPALPTNPLFTAALAGIPTAPAVRNASEFQRVLRPFQARVFASGIPQSHGDIGPMAIAVAADGSVLASGGAARNEIYRFSPEGGTAEESLIAVAPHPIFDLAYDRQGRLWATTGGGPLLQLDRTTGAVLAEFGEGITQSLAVHPESGVIYVSSSGGVEIFDPQTGHFQHFSDRRAGSLAFSPDGRLWAASWPDRGQVLRFDHRGRTEVMLRFDTPVDSLAFGQTGTSLQNLLFVSQNAGRHFRRESELTLVNLATLQQVAIARGGSRGDIIRTTADGRVLLSQSHQIDVLNPIQPPRVIASNPAPHSAVALPRQGLSLTFDQAMLDTSADDDHSVLNPDNYLVVGQDTGPIEIEAVAWDPASHTVLLAVAPLAPGRYRIEALPPLHSAEDQPLAESYVAEFLAVSDYSELLDVRFSRGRADAAMCTVSYDVIVENLSTYDLQAPVVLTLEGLQPAMAQATGGLLDPVTGDWQIDLTASLPNGLLLAGSSTTGQSVTVFQPGPQRLEFTTGVLARPAPNQAPVFTSEPLTAANTGQAYSYEAAANDPDNRGVVYLLYDGPDGMSVHPTTGLVTWTPPAVSAAEVSVILQAYDPQGAAATQEFVLDLTAGNTPPEINLSATELEGREGELLQIAVYAFDLEGDRLISWADQLPGGAAFDPDAGVLSWTPTHDAAGVYEGVTFVVSDGVHRVRKTATITVLPTKQPPVLLPVPAQTVREGDPLRIALSASDPEGHELTYFSHLLPGGALLDPRSGVFQWTPAYFQHGNYEVPFLVTNGEQTTTQIAQIEVLNVNAPPQFEGLDYREVQEGQLLILQSFAFDPDNPSYVPPYRAVNGELYFLEDVAPTVSYAAENLPAGAQYDAETGTLTWVPDYTQAGLYEVTFRATDDGDGTGLPLVVQQTLPIRVFNTNRPPTVEPIVNHTMQRGEVLGIEVQSDDPDATPMVLSVSGLPRFATFVDHGDGTGTFQFAPRIGDRGNHVITVTATDSGEGGSPPASAAQSFVLTVESLNEPPQLARIGDKVAIPGQKLEFFVEAKDLDQDPLTWTASGLPAGATLTPTSVYGRARFAWTPTASDLGTRDVTFIVTDSGNGDAGLRASDQQVVRLVVRATNEPPVVPEFPEQTVAEGNLLEFIVSASDPDGDSLLLSVGDLPWGAAFDSASGLFRWTPNFFQARAYHLPVTATDGHLTGSGTLTITVSNTNQSPQLVPLVTQSGREGTPLQFTLIAGDVDNQPLTFQSLSTLPAGASLDAATGRFRWTPDYDQQGDYVFRFAARDPYGLTDERDVRISIADVNRIPKVKVSDRVAIVGQLLDFVIRASDADQGDVLRFSAEGLPAGATLNAQTGRLQWTPHPSQVGDHTVSIAVSDGKTTASRTLRLRARFAYEPPTVLLETTPSFPVPPGTQVRVTVRASSLTDIVSTSLSVDGQAVALDELGRATLLTNQIGRLRLEATATDVEGLIGRTESALKVRDPSDHAPPEVAFAEGLDGAMLTVAGDLRGSVADQNLDYWVLQQARAGSDAFLTIAAGDAPFALGPLPGFDPARLENGFYRLRLSAADLTGRLRRTEITVEVNTATKTDRLLDSATDLTLELGGVPVTIVRQYDSLRADQSSAFGFGWRWAERDFAVETNIPRTGREALGDFTPLSVGDRLFVSLPDGRRIGFTFQPVRHELPGVIYYAPAWQADAGVEYRLDSAGGKLQMARDRLFDLHTARPYHPASDHFDGPEYTLTAPDGTRYYLSSQRGVEEMVTPGGVSLVYSDSGITAANGEAVRFERDAAGRLTKITAPDGTVVVYTYDAAGRLVSARKPGADQWHRYAYEESSGRLELLVAPEGQASQVIRYTPAPQVLPVVANLGPAHQFNGQVRDGSLAAGAVDRYVFGVHPSELRSTQGQIVYLGVLAEPAAGSSVELGRLSLPGAIAVLERQQGNATLTLFALEASGWHHVELSGASGTTSGAYRLRVFVAGDVNQDGRVNGVDAELVAAALGKVAGEAGYTTSLDVDRDGRIENADLQLVAANFSFAANRPPVLTATTEMTHVDLEAVYDLSKLATDAEGDAIHFRIAGATNGTAQITADGRTALFSPTPSYAGPAQILIQADDGYSTSAAASIDVNVSNAPLVGLDFVQRMPHLDSDRPMSVLILGDFADQQQVPLPPSYLTLTSSDADIFTVSQDGFLRAIAPGSGVLQAAARGLQAVTAVTVGVPTDTLNLIVDVMGLNVYPGAISLPEDGQRQLLARVDEQWDLTSAASGSVYFSSNPAVASVTADGLVAAQGIGQAVITVIHGPAESTVRLIVDHSQPGPVTLATVGGLVRATDGALLQVPPGAVSEPTEVTIATIAEAELPFALPEHLEYAAGYDVQIGEGELQQPLQLSFPVPAGTPAGETIYLYRPEVLPDGEGGTIPTWIQTDVAVVGADGMAHTTSPPYPGLTRGQKIVAMTVKGTFSGLIARLHGVIKFAYETVQRTAVVEVLGNGVGLGAYAGDALEFPFNLIGGFKQLKVITVPSIGIPSKHDVSLRVDANTVNQVQLSIQNLPPDKRAPLLDNAELQLDPFDRPKLVLSGQYFGDPALDEVDVRFILGEEDTQSSTVGSPDFEYQIRGGLDTTLRGLQLTSSDSIELEVPRGTVLGLAEIRLVRVVKDSSGKEIDRRESNPLRVQGEGKYAFVAQRSANQLAVIDVQSTMPDPLDPFNPNAFVKTFENVRNIHFGLGGVYGTPRQVAVTQDNTRAYVLTREYLWPVDALALQEVESQAYFPQNQPPKPWLGAIHLGGRASHLIIDRRDQFLYVSDERTGLIHVVDIRPVSDVSNSIDVGPFTVTSPFSQRGFNHVIGRIPLPDASLGLRALAITPDNRYLLAAAPNYPAGGINTTQQARRTTPQKPEGDVYVIDIDPTSPTYWQIQLLKTGEAHVDVIPVNQYPWGLSATNDPRKVLVTHYLGAESRAVSVLERSTTGWKKASDIPLILGTPNDSFDVESPREIVTLPDATYAFVLGYALPDPGSFTDIARGIYASGIPARDHGVRLALTDPNYSRYHAGSNIGIIEDPLGPNPRLVAATRPIPAGFPLGLALSPDGKELYATFNVPTGPSGNGAVFVYDVEAITKEIADSRAAGESHLLDLYAINDIVEGSVGPDLSNLYIDTRAAYRVNPDSSRFSYAFEVYEPTQAPIGIGHGAAGIAVQSPCFVRLVDPVLSTPDQMPTFRWEAIGAEIKSSKIYVSTHPYGKGLFPSDFSGPDGNPNRIVNGVDVGSDLQYVLPGDRTLTAGQTYYWGIEAVATDWRPCRVYGTFLVEPKQLGTPFNNVTIITHGFQFDLDPGATAHGRWMETLGQVIADASGGGSVLMYNKAAGTWEGPDPIPGQGVVLVSDWVSESDISDSGFAEAAADAIFASLVRLDQRLDGDIFASQLHFIGHSRGTVVNSEIIQRLGTHFPGVRNIHMTTLDPHDQVQQSLDIPLKKIVEGVDKAAKLLQKLAQAGTRAPNPLIAIVSAALDYGIFLLRGLLAASLETAQTVGVGIDPIRYSDFLDPDVQVWDNVGFADNYYQTNAGEPLTFTPRGWPVPNADRNLLLDGRVGFTQDDLSLLGYGFGWGGPHSRVWQWYAGTAALNLNSFHNEPLFRKRHDVDPNWLLDLLPNYRPFEDFDDRQPNPWYNGDPDNPAPLSSDIARAAWEGILEGWYYSELGGGGADRPPGSGVRVPVTDDNSDDGGPRLTPAVPSIFNGDFEWGNMHRKNWPRNNTTWTELFKSNRFPLSYEVPGWSFHGGSGFSVGGVDVTAALVLETDIRTYFKDMLESYVDRFGEQLQDVMDQGRAGQLPPEWNAAVNRIAALMEDMEVDVEDIVDGIKQAIGSLGTFQKAASDRALLLGGQKLLEYVYSRVPVPYFQDTAQRISQMVAPLNRLTHNWMLIPESAEVLRFDVSAPFMVDPDARINVYLNVPTVTNGDQLVDTVEMLPSFFQTNTHWIAVPQNLRGQVGTLTLEVVNAERDLSAFNLTGVLSQLYFLDNVMFAPAAPLEVTALPDPREVENRVISVSDAECTVEAGMERWRVEGANPDVWVGPLDTRIEVVDLRGGSVALVSESASFATILLDDNAAGHGWFVDATPWDNEEFEPSASGDELLAREDSSAYGKIDLLTVLMHEMGHLLGLGHDDWSGTSTGLMSTPLPTGVRRLPSAADVEALNALHRATTTVDVGHSNGTASSDAAAGQLADLGTVETTGTQERTAWDDGYVWSSWLPANGAAAQSTSPFQALHTGCDQPPTGPLTNGGFTQGTDGLSGWTATHPSLVSVDSSRRAVLRESAQELEAALYQDFVLPSSAYFLSFVLSGLTLDASVPNGAMPDAFGVSLVDPCSGLPLVATRDPRTDSYYIRDLISGANTRDAAAGVLVTPGPDHGSWRITVDVSAQAGRPARLFFRLLSGSDGSQTAASVAVSQVIVGTLPALNVLEDSGTTPLGLAGYTPVGTTAATAVTVMQVPLPDLGGVVLADGSTAVTTAESYSLAQLQGTQFRTMPDEHGADLLLFQIPATGGGEPLTNFVPIAVAPVNDAPAFTRGPDVIIPEDAGPQSVAGWATGIRSGPANEAGQTLDFALTTSDDTFFAVLPSIDADSGTLTFTPVPAAQGVVTVTVALHDDGGTAHGGMDHSDPRTFTITVDNAPMTIEAGENQAGDEGQRFRVESAAFADFGRRGGYLAEVDWGDGTPVMPGQIAMHPDTPGDPLPPLTGSVSAEHVYADDGVYTVIVRVRNANMPSGVWLADQFTVTVANVAPSVTIHGIPAENVPVGADIALTSTVVEPGTADTFTYLWSVTHNGAPYLERDTAALDFAPSVAGHYLVTLTVQDDDGDAGSDSRAFAATASEPLRVAEVIINDGAAQRSNLETIRVRFNQQTNLQTLMDTGQIGAAIQFVDSSGRRVFEDAARFRYVPANFELQVDLTTDGFGGSRSTLLADGRYALHLDTTLISAAADPAVRLEEDDDLADAIRRIAVHRMLADFDGDADVDLVDRDLYFLHHGSVEGETRYDFAFDLNGDRRINNTDYALWKLRYGKKLP